MPVSLDALSTLDLALIASVALLSLVCGGLTLRLQQQGPPSDASPLADTPEPEPDADLKNVLDEREAQLKTAQQDAKDAREEAELTLLQLHQVQEELEQIFLADQSKEKQLNSTNDQLKTAQQDAKDAREEAELTLLQLHQVQEELEHYFLQSRTQDDLLRQHQEQSSEFKSIISKLVNRQT